MFYFCLWCVSQVYSLFIINKNAFEQYQFIEQLKKLCEYIIIIWIFF